MRRSRSRGQQAAEAVTLVVSLAIQLWAVWLILPEQQRMWLRLGAAGRVRSVTARAAFLMGHQGMGEELRTGQRSLRYLAAWGLSMARDLAHKQIEAMRP